MSRKLTTADRVMLLMSLVPYLKENGPTPVRDLAQMFAVEPEDLRQLIRFLGVAGVPGETQTYQHEDLFDIDWDALEHHDQVSLTQTVAVDDTPRFSSVETAALTAGLQSLVPMLPGELRAAALSTAEKLASVQPVDGGTRSVSISDDPLQSRVTEITSAIAAGVQLTFEYRAESGALSRRTVEPLLLSQAGGTWYLRAFCTDRQAERTFMIDRIRDPNALGQAAMHVAASTTAQVVRVEGAHLTAMLRLTRAALQRISDFVPRVLGQSEPGWLYAEVDLLHPAVAVRLIQAAPGELVVEGPAAARAAVHDWATRALLTSDA